MNPAPSKTICEPLVRNALIENLGGQGSAVTGMVMTTEIWPWAWRWRDGAADGAANATRGGYPQFSGMVLGKSGNSSGSSGPWAGLLECTPCKQGPPQRPPTLCDQPKSALQISSMTSDDAQASVVGTDHSSIWCLACLTPSIRLMTQK